MENSNVLPISSAFQHIHQLQTHLNRIIVGQSDLIKKILIALLADGHLLVEGAPGLAKTKAVKSLADAIEGAFHRIQFTPDLLPGDLTGTDIYQTQTASFKFQPGPIFNNFVLADEINRAPAKVQSALLEAMAERQITVGNQTYRLPELFLVMATQNPIEQEGTYPLPEAQLDRFLMQVIVDYPDMHAEHQILSLARQEVLAHQVSSSSFTTITEACIHTARQDCLKVHTSESIQQYIVDLVLATRQPNSYSKQLASHIQYGASPRATIALDRCAKIHAWLKQRDYVSPEDIHAIVFDILRHRLVLSYKAEAEGVKSDDVIAELLDLVAIP